MNEVKVNIGFLRRPEVKTDEFSKNGKLTVRADKNVVSNIEREGDELKVTTVLKDEDNLVLHLGDGWLYQSNPKMPENGNKAFQWQAISLDRLSRDLVAPGSLESWCV